MIDKPEDKTKRELVEIVKIQQEEYVKLLCEYNAFIDVAEDCCMAKTKEEACEILEEFLDLHRGVRV